MYSVSKCVRDCFDTDEKKNSLNNEAIADENTKQIKMSAICVLGYCLFNTHTHTHGSLYVIQLSDPLTPLRVE